MGLFLFGLLHGPLLRSYFHDFCSMLGSSGPRDLVKERMTDAFSKIYVSVNTFQRDNSTCCWGASMVDLYLQPSKPSILFFV